MAAFTKTLGSSATTSYTGYTNDGFRSSYVPSATGVNVNGAIPAGVAATNKPIVITFFREVFPTNSGSSARLELDTASTGTAVYTSSYRNCSGNEDVVPNYKMNAGETVWAGFRTGSTATINFYSGPTSGASDEIIRSKAGVTSTFATDRNLYIRLDWYGVPAAPASPVATSATATTVTLSWTKPTDMGGYSALTGYRILYKKPSDSEYSWISTGKFGDDTTTSYMITGLTLGTEYQFKIAATNAATDIYNTDYSALSATVGTNADITVSTTSGGIWNGSGQWVTPGVKVWNGSWVSANLNVWTGTEWKRQ